MSYISCLCCERTPNRSCWYWHTDLLVLTNKRKLITPIHEVYSFQAPWSTYKLYSDNPIAIIINVIIITLCFIRGKRWETLRITNRNICNSCVVRKAVILSDVWHKTDSDHSSYSLTRGTSNCYLAFSSLVFFFLQQISWKKLRDDSDLCSPGRSRIVKKQRNGNISEKFLNGVIIVSASGAAIHQFSVTSHEKQLSVFQQQRSAKKPSRCAARTPVITFRQLTLVKHLCPLVGTCQLCTAALSYRHFFYWTTNKDK